ncbi:MAG: hypothetical protein OEY36_01920 [Gammaproteobacteria bacterium]|nr:hypothetical protein [Gammaproteobacteria bacterium]
MNTNYYLLVTISVLAGFFMRPLHQFILGRGISLVRHVSQKNIAIVILISSMIGGMATTLFSIYLALKLGGFIPLNEQAIIIFIASFLVGGVLWIFYARRFNKVCRIGAD